MLDRRFDLINPEPPLVMHIDLNSAFATTEQQAHPLLRGKPIGVTNRISKECCILAASYEAKALGIKVGMRLSEARALCPHFIVLETDAPKYNIVYKKLLSILRDYSPDAKMKSIDEGVIDFHGLDIVRKGRSLVEIGYEIKQRVRDEIGDYMMVNVGIGPNRFLAKQAAGWHKPDGLDVIDASNLRAYYESITLTDLCGIARRHSIRLRSHGIASPIQFLDSSERFLKKQVFGSINGTYWYRRLRGHEIDAADTKLGMVGRQWVVKEPSSRADYLNPCLSYLCETTGVKLRYRGVRARGVCVWARLRSGEYWHAKQVYPTGFFSNQAVYARALEQFEKRPSGAIVQTIGIYCYKLEPSVHSQLSFFENIDKMRHVTDAVDSINDAYGQFTVHSATSLAGKRLIKQKIPFGGTQYFDLLLKRA